MDSYGNWEAVFDGNYGYVTRLTHLDFGTEEEVPRLKRGCLITEISLLIFPIIYPLINQVL
jgi:hypothetical protein